MNKTGLGKGLSALIPLSPEGGGQQEQVDEIEIKSIKPNAYQPRRSFDMEKLEELAESIKVHGVVQPIVVRKLASGKYELVVGERRLRACRHLGKDKIPAVVKDYTDGQMMEIALVENIQRQDLNPIEEAYAYKRLLEDFKMTQEQLAQRVAKSRSFIANMVRLLNLPQVIIDHLRENRLTVGHARPLLAIADEERKIKAAAEIIEKNLSVRDTEILIRGIVEEEKKQAEEKKSPAQKRRQERLSPVMADLEAKLRSLCGTKVKINDNGGKGKIEIEYYTLDDLDRISALFLQGEVL